MSEVIVTPHTKTYEAGVTYAQPEEKKGYPFVDSFGNKREIKIYPQTLQLCHIHWQQKWILSVYRPSNAPS